MSPTTNTNTSSIQLGPGPVQIPTTVRVAGFTTLSAHSLSVTVPLTTTTTFSTSAITAVPLPTFIILNDVIVSGFGSVLLVTAPSNTIFESTHSLSATVTVPAIVPLATTTFTVTAIPPIPTAFQSQCAQPSFAFVSPCRRTPSNFEPGALI